MTPAGWTVMIVSVGAVLTLMSYCLYRVLTLPPADVEAHLEAPPDIDTGDTESFAYGKTACASCGRITRSSAAYCAHCGHPLR